METKTSSRVPILAWIVGTSIFGLYLYAIAAAIGNWRGMAQIAEVLADGLSVPGIVWLAVGVAIPVLALVSALIIGRRKPWATKLLILALGLTIVAVLQLDIMHLVPTTLYLGE